MSTFLATFGCVLLYIGFAIGTGKTLKANRRRQTRRATV